MDSPLTATAVKSCNLSQQLPSSLNETLIFWLREYKNAEAVVTQPKWWCSTSLKYEAITWIWHIFRAGHLLKKWQFNKLFTHYWPEMQWYIFCYLNVTDQCFNIHLHNNLPATDVSFYKNHLVNNVLNLRKKKFNYVCVVIDHLELLWYIFLNIYMYQPHCSLKTHRMSCVNFIIKLEKDG